VVYLTQHPLRETLLATKNPIIADEVFKAWCGAGLNRRHKDFQSFALPTELPHHPLLFLERAAKIGLAP
jgi:hypothetical protein